MEEDKVTQAHSDCGEESGIDDEVAVVRSVAHIPPDPQEYEGIDGRDDHVDGHVAEIEGYAHPEEDAIGQEIADEKHGSRGFAAECDGECLFGVAQVGGVGDITVGEMAADHHESYPEAEDCGR